MHNLRPSLRVTCRIEGYPSCSYIWGQLLPFVDLIQGDFIASHIVSFYLVRSPSLSVSLLSRPIYYCQTLYSFLDQSFSVLLWRQVFILLNFMKYEFNVTSIDFKVTVAFTIPHLQQYTYNYTTCTIDWSCGFEVLTARLFFKTTSSQK